MLKLTGILLLLALGLIGCNPTSDTDTQQRMEESQGQLNSGSMGGETPNAGDYQQGQQQGAAGTIQN